MIDLANINGADYARLLNLILGFGGMVSFGHAAFVGVGAYTLVALAVSAYLALTDAFLDDRRAKLLLNEGNRELTNQLTRGDDGLFRTTSGDPMANDANARMAAGALEGSNVNAVETMVGMIQVARQFETQMRLLQLAEAGDKSASQLLGVQG